LDGFFVISVSSASSSQPIDELELLDWGTKIGVAARGENVRPAQLENLIASLDTVSGREALLATAGFALRQAGRREKRGEEGLIGRRTADLVSRALVNLYERGAGKDHARKMLGFAKWIYEANIPYRDRAEQLTLLQLLKWYLQQRQQRQQRTG
jgi:hypothetical protein